jgi:hypothetical protein
MERMEREPFGEAVVVLIASAVVHQIEARQPQLARIGMSSAQIIVKSGLDRCFVLLNFKRASCEK